MKNEIYYEWILETINEDGDIEDIDFSETLVPFIGQDGDIGLVRNEGNESDGVGDRYWAYINDGKLPEYFQDGAGEPTKIKVPAKYHAELKQTMNN